MTDSGGVSEEARRVLDECAMYWRAANGLPAEEVREMRSELEQHLREAEGEGRTASEVVGGDTLAFAHQWGESRERPRPFVERTLEMAAYSGAGAAGFLAACHLWHRSLRFPFDLKKQAGYHAFGEFVAATLLMRLRATARSEGTRLPAGFDQPVWGQALKSAGANLAGGAALLGLNYVAGGRRETAFSRWSWRSTLALALLSVPLMWAARDPVRPEEIGVTSDPGTAPGGGGR